MRIPDDINCESARTRIDLAVTGDLPDEDKQSLDAHLAACEACAKRLATRRALWEHYPAGIFPTEKLLARTLARVGKRRAIRFSWNATPLRAAVAALAAAALMIFTAALYIRHFSKEDDAGSKPASAAIAGPGETENDVMFRQVLAALEGKTDQPLSIDVGNDVKILVLPRRQAAGPGYAAFPETEAPSDSDARLADWVY